MKIDAPNSNIEKIKFVILDATPGTNPPVGSVFIYVKDDGLVYTLDDGGVESQVGSSTTGFAITSLASDQSVSSLADLTGMSMTKTLASGDKYKWSFEFTGVKSSTGTLTVYITDGSNTVLQERYQAITDGYGQSMRVTFIETGAGSSVTRKVRAVCDTGSFNFDVGTGKSCDFTFEKVS